MNRPKTKRPDGALTALCHALKLGKSRVSVLLREGMPENPAAAVAWKQDREKARESGDTSAEALRGERIKLVRAQRERAVIENRIRSGEFIERAVIDDRDLRLGHIVRAELMKLANDLPPVLEGLDAARICNLLKTEVHRVLEHLASDQGPVAKMED